MFLQVGKSLEDIRLRPCLFDEDEFEDEEPLPKAEGMGFIGKALVGFAMLVFLGTLGVVGFVVYKNLDKFTQ